MKKRICIYSEKWELNGGVEKYILNNLRYIDTTSASFFILVSQIETDDYSVFLKDRDIELIPVLNTAIQNPVKRTIYTVLQIRNILKKYQFDAIEFNISNAVSLIYVYLAKLSGIKRRIVHSHNSYITVRGLKGKLKLCGHYFFKYMFKGVATDYTACSDLAAKWMFMPKMIERNEVVYLKNGIDTLRFFFSEEKRALLRRKYKLENKLVIGNIGRMHSQKNHFFLLAIFKELLKVNKDSILVLIGDGELFEMVRTVCVKEKMEKSVLFIKKTEEIDAFLSSMDVLVMPSIYEGFPFVALEAQANGLPCVFSDKITHQVCISQNSIQLPLTMGVNKWVEKILEYSTKRQKYQTDAIKTFNLKDTAKEYEKFLLK